MPDSFQAVRHCFLRFILFRQILGVQGTGGVEHSQHHHAHIGKDGGPHAGHADRAQHKAGKRVGAICAAPMVLASTGILDGKKATCYPGFDKFLEGAEYTGNMVEVVDNFILGKGPGAAPAFGFTILEKFAGAEKALEVKKGMLLA